MSKPYVLFGVLEVANDVVDKVGSISLLHNLSVKSAWLSEVIVGMVGLESSDLTSYLY